MLDVGATIGGRYLLRERLGGASSVWRADDTSLRQTVVLKVLPPAVVRDPALTQRFHTQAQAIGALDHPSIAKVIDAGQDGAVPYLVTQYVVGESLRSFLRRVGRLTAGQTMALMAEAGQALHAAHTAGVAHGDITPGCLLIRGDGRLVLTGFGVVARRTQDRLKRPSSAVDTAPYLAPEQVRDEPPVAATDVYALGVVAYECLTGRPPFTGEDAAAVATMHVHDDPPVLPEEVPATARYVVERALAKDRAARWSSAQEFAEAAHRASSRRPGLSTVELTTPVEAAGGGPVPKASHVPKAGPVPAASQQWGGPGIPDGSGDSEIEPRATSRRRLLFSAIAASIALVGVGLATLPALASWRGSDEPGTVAAGPVDSAPVGTQPLATWSASAIQPPVTSEASASSSPTAASAQPRSTTTTRTSKPATKPATTTAPPPTRYYKFAAGVGSPQFRDGSCVYTIAFGNYGSVGIARVRFYAGDCGTVTVRVAAQRGDVMTYENATPGTTAGTDSCGTYFEAYVMTSGDPAYAVGIRLRFPSTGSTYVYHYVNGIAPPVHRNC